MKTLAFVTAVVFGSMVYGGEVVQDCANGKCAPRQIVRHAVAVPLRVVHAVVPNCNGTSCNRVVAPVEKPAQVVEATPVVADCKPCQPARRHGLLSKLRAKVKSHCCK